ncbi:MAG: 4a-hydroxytetrahydrobiopterin dehydratase [Candidatus Paceibacterota bacterium]
MKKLSESQIQARLEHLAGWEGDEAVLQKEFRFADFVEAMEFVNLVGEKAEELGHHPDICISYNSVVCMVTTHEKGGLTEADFKLAGLIEAANERLVGEWNIT